MARSFTRWPDQLDFSTELSKVRAAKPDAVFVFYPGAAGVQFLTQYVQAGLKGQIPLYTAFTIDELSLPLQKDLALGVPGAQQWVNDLPNEANKKFVADFKAKHQKPTLVLRRAVLRRRQSRQQRGGGGERRSHQEGRDARRDAQGQLSIGARALQIRQQPLPDSELLSAGRGQGCTTAI